MLYKELCGEGQSQVMSKTEVFEENALLKLVSLLESSNLRLAEVAAVVLARWCDSKEEV